MANYDYDFRISAKPKTKTKVTPTVEIPDAPGESNLAPGSRSTVPERVSPEETYDEPIDRSLIPDLEAIKQSTFEIPAVEAPAGFDFNQAFDEALRSGRQVRRQNDFEIDEYGGVPDPGVETDKTKILQPNVLVPVNKPGLERGRGRIDPKTEAMDILMREFFSPAMGVGQRLLPAVWTELSSLAAQNRRSFRDVFAAALDEVRKIENAWFSGLLGETPPQRIQMYSGSPEERELFNRIMEVLNRYYSTVLETSAKNSRKMVQRMKTLSAMTTPEEFKQAFFDALSETRDAEDKIFKNYMTRMLRL